MFVLIISRGFPSLQDVMIGNFEADQARALYALGHKVVVLSIDRRLKAHDRHIGFNHRVIDGIDVYNFYMFPMPIKTMYKLGYFYIVQMVRFLYRIILRNHGRPDIIHAHYLYTMPIALKLKEILYIAFQLAAFLFFALSFNSKALCRFLLDFMQKGYTTDWMRLLPFQIVWE